MKKEVIELSRPGLFVSNVELGFKFARIILIIHIILIIIITRPKPAYGRQGLAGSWGQDTDEVSTFFGVLNVSLRACGAQLGFNQPGTINDNENPPRNLEKL